MKGFFLLLLITNVGFIGWQFFAVDTDGTRAPYVGGSQDNEGLRLLSELSEADRPAARKLLVVDETTQESVAGKVELIELTTVKDKEPAAAIAGDTSIQCYQSTLLANLKEAKGLQASLVKLGVKGSQRSTVDTSNVNYWVKLNPYKSKEKANEAAAILKKNQVKDFFIVRSGRHENAISLGVFSTRDRAEARYKSITALKVNLRKPVIEAMELPAKRLLVHFVIEPDEAPAGLDKLLDSTKSPHLKKIVCN